MSAFPALGPSVPRRGSRAALAFGKTVLGLLRWRVEGEVPDLPKFVIAVAPHTSNWDFVIGAAMRWLGGVPVDRTSAHGVVGDAIAQFARCDARLLAIAPQGTRKPTRRFRSGFLHIARGARVPVMLATLDWGRRTVRFGPTF
ncbi:MAG: 1-acyl-sn-glycerol-3-phosphate acyltransferase, partial [Usitatibacter sp.]